MHPVVEVNSARSGRKIRIRACLQACRKCGDIYAPSRAEFLEWSSSNARKGIEHNTYIREKGIGQNIRCARSFVDPYL